MSVMTSLDEALLKFPNERWHVIYGFLRPLWFLVIYASSNGIKLVDLDGQFTFPSRVITMPIRCCITRTAVLLIPYVLGSSTYSDRCWQSWLFGVFRLLSTDNATILTFSGFIRSHRNTYPSRTISFVHVPSKL